MAEKKVILNLRLKPETRDEFAIVADLRGSTMSGLIHQFIVRSIREEKEAAPQAFPKQQAKPLRAARLTLGTEIPEHRRKSGT